VIHPSKNFAFKIQKLIYFHKRPILLNFKKKIQQVSMLPWNWSIFIGDLPIMKFKSWLIYTGDLPFSIFKKNFSKCLYSLKVVYFHEQYALFKLQQASMLLWSWCIFTGDQHFSNFKKNFSKRSYFSKIGLFSRAACPFWNSKTSLFYRRPVHFEIQKLVYFHGWLTLFKFQKELQQASMLPWNWSIFLGNPPILKFKY